MKFLKSENLQIENHEIKIKFDFQALGNKRNIDNIFNRKNFWKNNVLILHWNLYFIYYTKSNICIWTKMWNEFRSTKKSFNFVHAFLSGYED